MLRIIATAVVFTAVALADNVTIGGGTGVTVQGCGLFSNPISVSSACGSASLTYAIFTGPIFDILSASGMTSTVDNVPGTLGTNARSTVDIYETETLEITGGTGQATAILQFLLFGNGSYRGNSQDASASAVLLTLNPYGDYTGVPCQGLYGILQGQYTCIDDNNHGSQGFPVSDYVNFTFGVPFQASINLYAIASSSDQGNANFTASSVFESFAVTQNGSAFTGATLMNVDAAPEPSEAWSCFLFLSGLAIVTVRRKQA